MVRPERWRLRVATGLGLGRLPFAPGTWGSLAGLLLVPLLWWLGGGGLLLAGTVVVTLLGFRSAGAAETHFGERDPGAVVIDEVAGQMTSLLFLVPTLPTLLVGFVLFRLFDIGKPFPVGRAERLPGASGIMADDLVAGVLANLVQQVLHRGFPGWWAGG